MDFQWIIRGDHEALQHARCQPERVCLNAAWSALAAVDGEYADRLVPHDLQSLGARDWSLAAEGALIRGLCAYSRGDLSTADAFAGLARTGLSKASRDALLHPAMLLQASIAMHRGDRDGVIATRHHLVDPASAWSEAIEAIAALATGAYDQALAHAHMALQRSDDEQIGPHLAPSVAALVIATVYRDRGDENTSAALEAASQRLRHSPHLPLLLELRMLRAHHHLDHHHGDAHEAIAGAVALGTYPDAAPEFQDLVDLREAHLQIRSHDLTRARVLLDRVGATTTRDFLLAYIDAETRPSRATAYTSSGMHRWHSHLIEVEMIRARTRHRELPSAAVHIWRALDLASESGAIRPLLDNPMADRLFSHPDLGIALAQTEVYGSPAATEQLKRVLQVHAEHALSGPEPHALTARELEVLRAVCSAGDFSSVARAMVVSRWTVRGHFYSACRKLGVSGREAAELRLQQIDQPRANPRALDVVP